MAPRFRKFHFSDSDLNEEEKQDKFPLQSNQEYSIKQSLRRGQIHFFFKFMIFITGVVYRR